MFKKYYIYYAKGEGCHDSGDDVAIIKARSKKQALKILKEYVKTEGLKFDLYKIKIPMSKYNDKKVLWISDY